MRSVVDIEAEGHPTRVSMLRFLLQRAIARAPHVAK
jgi:hypothetical protein